MQKPLISDIPDSPGSYQFKDKEGRIIYVGKARSLRSRLANYFQDPLHLSLRTAQMVASADSVEWIQVRNEVEALMLEYNLIKLHHPRFNIRLKDDKSYPYLAISLSDPWPRPVVMRGKKKKGTRYFGPYAQAYAIRETLDLLLKSFPVRTCSDHKFATHSKTKNPCLLFHIEKCCAPCMGEVSKQDYDQLVQDLVEFLSGETDQIITKLESEMLLAAQNLAFERAGYLRDRLASVKRAIERQQMVTEKSQDLDIVGVAEDELEASIQVFFIRKGRVSGRKGFVIDKVEDLNSEQLIAKVLEQLYGDLTSEEIPKEILLPYLPDNLNLYEQWLSTIKGSKVSLRIPQRGDKKDLQQTVTTNAKEEFRRHRLKRSSDHNARAKALLSLQQSLNLPLAPLRIECYDMSHIQGTDYVGSMVVVEDGLAKNSEYRRFKVKTVAGNDDYGAMREVLTRRLNALIAQNNLPLDQRSKKFSYFPNLLLVDGGKGQLNVAIDVLKTLGLSDKIPVASLAKSFEEVYLPGQKDPIRLPRQSEALYLLQRIRDESHRFAITYHRSLRTKRMTASILDSVPGIGPSRKKRLLKEFSTIKALKQASLEEVLSLSWLPNDTGEALYKALHEKNSSEI